VITATRLATSVYAVLMRLYPQTFRVEFEEEMQAVFAQALVEAAGRGGLSLVGLCLREIGDLAPVLVQEYWSEFRNRRLGQREKVAHQARHA